MLTLKLFRFLNKKQDKFGKRPTISSPIIIREKINGDSIRLDSMKKVNDAKSERNLACLEEIKATLLKWKEEDDRIFTEYKHEKLLLSSQTDANPFSPELFHALDFWSSQNYKKSSNRSYSEASRDKEKLVRSLSNRSKRTVSVRRLERSNSFRDLGKVLIRRDSREASRDFL